MVMKTTCSSTRLGTASTTILTVTSIRQVNLFNILMDICFEAHCYGVFILIVVILIIVF